MHLVTAEIDEMLAPYGFVSRKFDLLDEGMLNTNVRVQVVDQDDLLLRIYNPDRVLSQVEREVSTLRRLIAAGVHCQEPQQGVGGFVHRFGDRYYTVLSFIPGLTLEDGTRDGEVSRTVGRLLGAVHKALASDTTCDAAIAGQELSEIGVLVLKHATVLKGLSERWKLAESLVLAQPPIVGVVHGDVHPGNVVRTAGRELVLIDYDDVAVGSIYLDIATGAMEFAFGNSDDLDTKLVADFIVGYEEANRAIDSTPLISAIWLSCFRFFAYTAELSADTEGLESNIYYRRLVALSDPRVRLQASESTAAFLSQVRQQSGPPK